VKKLKEVKMDSASAEEIHTANKKEFHMDRFLLGLVVIAIVAVGLWAGGTGFLAGNHDSWSPREYVAKPGECFVPPQGDPLYDEHYAKNVNTFNCNALKVQSEAKNIDAQTARVQVETRQGIFGVFAILGVVAACVVLLIIAIVR
jgi:hypothetical protein